MCVQFWLYALLAWLHDVHLSSTVYASKIVNIEKQFVFLHFHLLFTWWAPTPSLAQLLSCFAEQYWFTRYLMLYVFCNKEIGDDIEKFNTSSWTVFHKCWSFICKFHMSLSVMHSAFNSGECNKNRKPHTRWGAT